MRFLLNSLSGLMGQVTNSGSEMSKWFFSGCLLEELKQFHIVEKL